MYNKEPAAAETATAETAAAEKAAIDAPDVSEHTDDAAGVVKQKREVNWTAEAGVGTLQAENIHRT